MKAGSALTWTAIVLLGGASAALGGWLGQRHQDASGPPLPPGFVVVEPGQAVPPHQLADLRTGELRPLAGTGRPRLLNWWASWCGPCREEMPLLDAFAKGQGDNGVEVVGIALDTPEDARRFLAQVPVTFPLLLDSPGPADTSVLLGNRRGLLPYTVLVDGEGRLLKTHYGPFPDGATLAAWAQPN